MFLRGEHRHSEIALRSANQIPGKYTRSRAGHHRGQMLFPSSAPKAVATTAIFLILIPANGHCVLFAVYGMTIRRGQCVSLLETEETK